MKRNMPKAKRTKKFATMKRMLRKEKGSTGNRRNRSSSSLIGLILSNKMDIVQSMMDTLYAKCIPYITDCVLGELEKLGSKFRIALKIVKDSKFERLPCMHKGTYADDCIVQRVTQHKCYIVATCDKDLKRRIRKIPGVPIIVCQSIYMGKGKSKVTSRNNAVFKVANGKVGKGKPKVMNTKLKSIKLQNSKKIESLNSKFVDYQQQNPSSIVKSLTAEKFVPIGDQRPSSDTRSDEKKYENVLEDLEKLK
ncbi:UTP24 [Lepeophtheirus salmonis]|uniref:UTP24 n=1 Tax=Lepeophtheirus salmonis TaxID=72036 RepID=A0A7R8CQ48_LEPSM|nr:UTP24 [Lepeophtheirus salmonis]CAF2889449.1 UTP24 [Lepeophtheirus salmonis]